MKVLFIISNFPPVIGGAERQAYRLAQTMRRQGTTVEVLTRYWSDLKREDSPNGIPVHRRGLPLGGKIGSVLGAFSWVIYLLRSGQGYQLFHAHQPYSALWIALLGKALWRGRVIVKIPGTHAIQYLEHSRLKRVVMRRYVDAVVVVNQNNREELIKLGLPSSQIWLIPNGIDSANFRPCFNYRRTKGERSVIFVGRLISTKGVDVLLESWKAIEAEMIPPPHLYIVGDGPERSRLEHLVDALELKNVRFTGMVKDVRPYLERAAMYVSPSKLEGLSNALLEAMAAGLPIVATEIAGMREVIRNGENGLLVEPGSSRALSSALLRLLRDSDLRERFGRAARETVENTYSIGLVAQQYEKLYVGLISNDK